MENSPPASIDGLLIEDHLSLFQAFVLSRECSEGEGEDEKKWTLFGTTCVEERERDDENKLILGANRRGKETILKFEESIFVCTWKFFIGENF